MSNTLQNVFNWGVVILFAGGLALTRGWPIDAALFPRLICGVGLAASLFNLVRHYVVAPVSASDEQADDENQTLMFAWAIGFFAAVWLFGFQIGLPLAVGAFYFFVARIGRWATLIAILLTAVSVWLVGAYLQVVLYGGALLPA